MNKKQYMYYSQSRIYGMIYLNRYAVSVSHFCIYTDLHLWLLKSIVLSAHGRTTEISVRDLRIDTAGVSGIKARNPSIASANVLRCFGVEGAGGVSPPSFRLSLACFLMSAIKRKKRQNAKVSHQLRKHRTELWRKNFLSYAPWHILRNSSRSWQN